MLKFCRNLVWLSGLAVALMSCTSTSESNADSYSVGDVGPAGGVVFITPSTPGNSTGQYFEAAPLSSEVAREWALPIVSGASGTEIGTGATNTAAIARQENGAINSAAEYASEYSLNGFSDWFLPSKDELFELYTNRDKIDGLTSSYYWSSTESSRNNAWLQNFEDGTQVGDASKGSRLYARPVRAFGQ